MSARLHPYQLAGMSPMRRTMAWLRARGYVVAIVERWTPGSGYRRDCFGCDLLAAHPEHGVRLVQVCGTDLARHVTKLRANEDAHTFVQAGGEVIVIGWRQMQTTGWTPRVWSMDTDTELELDEVLEGVEWQPALVREPDRIPDDAPNAVEVAP